MDPVVALASDTELLDFLEQLWAQSPWSLNTTDQRWERCLQILRWVDGLDPPPANDPGALRAFLTRLRQQHLQLPPALAIRPPANVPFS